MEIVYYTLVAAGLYFMSDWVLQRLEARDLVLDRRQEPLPLCKATFDRRLLRGALTD